MKKHKTVVKIKSKDTRAHILSSQVARDKLKTQTLALKKVAKFKLIP